MLNFINIFVLVVSIKGSEKGFVFPEHTPLESREQESSPGEFKQQFETCLCDSWRNPVSLTQTMVICAELG